MKLSKLYFYVSCGAGLASVLLYALTLVWLWEINRTFFAIGCMVAIAKLLMVASNWVLELADEADMKERGR